MFSYDILYKQCKSISYKLDLYWHDIPFYSCQFEQKKWMHEKYFHKSLYSSKIRISWCILLIYVCTHTFNYKSLLFMMVSYFYSYSTHKDGGWVQWVKERGLSIDLLTVSQRWNVPEETCLWLSHDLRIFLYSVPSFSVKDYTSNISPKHI